MATRRRCIRPHLLVLIAFLEDLDRDQLPALLVPALEHDAIRSVGTAAGRGPRVRGRGDPVSVRFCAPHPAAGRTLPRSFPAPRSSPSSARLVRRAPAPTGPLACLRPRTPWLFQCSVERSRAGRIGPSTSGTEAPSATTPARAGRVHGQRPRARKVWPEGPKSVRNGSSPETAASTPVSLHPPLSSSRWVLRTAIPVWSLLSAPLPLSRAVRGWSAARASARTSSSPRPDPRTGDLLLGAEA